MINVIDAIMGAGKTTYILNYLEKQSERQIGNRFLGQEDDTRFLVVAPLLSEVDRYTEACPSLDFRNPLPIKNRKLFGLKELIEEGANICTTHALFRMLSREIYDLLKAKNYVLIMDEVLSCVDLFDSLSEADRSLLFKHEYVRKRASSHRLEWNHERYPAYSGRFEDIRNLCDNGNLVWHRDKFLIWEFPVEFLHCFKDVFILTYLFRGSPMYLHLEASKVAHTMWTLRNGMLFPYAERDEREIKERLKSLVSVYSGSVRTRIEGGRTALSASWYKRALKGDVEALSRLKASSVHFFREVAGTKASLNGWTAFKNVKRLLSGGGYAKGWIPNNAKATNDYKDKASLAYLCNIFMHPVVNGYYADQKVKVDQDLYALSEMLQWIWRSRIREWQPISIYIPSVRMRTLFEQWLDNELSVDIAASEPLLMAA